MLVQSGNNRTLCRVLGVKLSAEAESVLERNRVAFVRSAIQECKETKLDFSSKGLGNAEAKAIAEN